MRPWSSTIILGIYLRTSPSQLNVKPPVLDLLIIGEKCGLGWSLSYLTATTILADVTHPHERAGLIGIMDFAVAIGAAMASLGGGEIYALGGLGVLGFVGMALTAPPFLAGLKLHESKVGVYEITVPESSAASCRSTVVGP
jgi:hypothetical protein